MIKSSYTSQQFLRSALIEEGQFLKLLEFNEWFEKCRIRNNFKIEQIPFSQLEEWYFETTTGNLVHISRRFFKIEGIWVETNFGAIPQWSQPIINQPEIGILGILSKKFDGILHFLMQLKMEPGNINMLQLAPTLQATRSNYMQVHKGRRPPYLEYFLNRQKSQVLVDVLQSEQGARFLQKRNRNIIIEVNEDADIPVLEDFQWFTLGQIQSLLSHDNVVNMDARTVLSCISFNCGEDVHKSMPDCSNMSCWGKQILKSTLDETNTLNSNDDIVSWFTEMKTQYDLNVEKISLKLVRDWIRNDEMIYHVAYRYFTVIGVRVEAGNREVKAWTQPLVKPYEPGILAFIVKDIRGVLHFLVQAKVEPGNFDIVEMAPTVQCLTGSYREASIENRPPFLDYILNRSSSQVMYDKMQSEEGGRFFHEGNRNMIILADSDFPEQLPDNYIWMTLGQIKNFIRYNNYVNVQARCLLACLKLL